MKNNKRNLKVLWLKLLTLTYLKLAKPASSLSRKIFEFKKINEAVGFGVLGVALAASIIPSSGLAFGGIKNVSKTTIETTTQKSLQKPVEVFHLTKGFSFFHPGLDFATDAGSAVLPILAGEVEKVERSRFGYGNYLVVKHSSGLKSLYAHFAKITVREGQKIDKNTIVGFIGSTGWSTGPHLHLEVIENGQKINPKTLFEDYFGKKLASSR